MNDYITEIENKLTRLPARTSQQVPENYIGGGQSKLKFIGLRVPQLRKVMHEGFSFSNQNDTDLMRIWDDIWWQSHCYEVMSLALDWFYDPERQPLLIDSWPILKKWSLKIDNWAHADTLAGIYSRILETHPKVIYSTLVQWNKSQNPWQRRLSIVSLIYYKSHRAKILPLKKILPLIKSQLDFDHYYVQKGVGWTLREAYNAYPQLVFAFIEKNVNRISATAFSAATEKMSNRERESLKKLRRKKL